ncbi:hypothetical protein [Vibrio campbellii]|uniref:Uncharacterized protein n=1 Tax=Vibrio campbellii TaxID=680 RepID=A0ABY5ICR6_9VIBR|nr:hypothetical protein [Vibrio campbellii]UTZ21480.1 hypothetical protein HB760_05860 [Vibrio campbellii]UTZ31140.1 hypothetical protein HB762_06900 [Vibrio campbellii]
MVKTFHSKNSTQNNNAVSPATKEPVKPKVKQFGHVESTRVINQDGDGSEAQVTKIEPTQVPVAAPSPKAPSVLFSNKISSIQSDIIDIEQELKAKIDHKRETEFPDLEINNSDYLIIANIFNSIKFDDHVLQIEFGKEESKKFQEVQGFLSDYAKLGKVDQILELGKVVIKLAKSININIFNPSKISTMIHGLMGSRREKVRKIRHEFDGVSDVIDARINRVFDNLQETHSTLEQFQFWTRELKSLNKKLQFKMLALKLKLESIDTSNTAENDDIPIAFQSSNNDVIQRWERKSQTLFALNQSITLTFPQLDLYTSNLLVSFERLEEIKVNILQVWKQQFLSVIAADESNDTTLYYELQNIQDQLIRNIEELR